MGKERVGWIGLGKMGAHMSKNLPKAGYPLIVYNRTMEKAKELADLGAGMDWNRMIDIIDSSVAASPSISYKTQMLKSRDFTPIFTINQMAKDFDIALDTGRALDIPMPITGLVRQFLGAMKAKGKGEVDFFGLVTLFEEMAGIES